MSRLLMALLRWILRHFFSFVLIVLVLVAGQWFHSRLQAAQSAVAEVEQLQAARPRLGTSLLSAVGQLQAQLAQGAQAGQGGGLTQTIDRLIAEKSLERDAIRLRSPFDGLPGLADFQRLAVLEMELAALNRAAADARQLTLLASDVAHGSERLKSLAVDRQRLRAQAARHELDMMALCETHRFKCRIPGTAEHARINRLAAEQAQFQGKAKEITDRIENLKLTVELSQHRYREAARGFGIDPGAVEAALARADAALAAESRRHGSFFWAAAHNFWSAISAQFPAAIGILALLVLVPIGIKLLLYFVIAPWAARQPPIQVLSRGAGIAANQPAASLRASAVSIPVSIEPGEELLLHSAYLQSSSAHSAKTTKWLLDWSYPFTSLAAGLYALVRVAPQQDETVVVSAIRDPLLEVALIEVAAGSALVLQPRALVGLVQPRSAPLRITRHWRVGHLHAWLTFQFRYLAFHGPARLIVRGCRGVRLEAAGRGRLINQAATLGFSADALYSVRRCETFVSYWRGDDELFNDQFAGEACVYAYEEMPGLHRHAGVTGRGLEGLADSLLKLFGI
ncbi:MAG: hypothetical protein Q8M11_19965 [Sulfuritalea sp.]|nr:hypothetical protein [Sulfuritalea sp.]MDP1984951.1 hypothetical protein [Sulfuritalea sp.]